MILNTAQKLALIKESLEEYTLMDNFDDAIAGVAERAGSTPVIAYDYNKCIEVLIAQGMSDEEAEEYFQFNCLGAYVGDTTPIFVTIF